MQIIVGMLDTRIAGISLNLYVILNEKELKAWQKFYNGLDFPQGKATSTSLSSNYFQLSYFLRSTLHLFVGKSSLYISTKPQTYKIIWDQGNVKSNTSTREEEIKDLLLARRVKKENEETWYFNQVREIRKVSTILFWDLKFWCSGTCGVTPYVWKIHW